MWGRHGEVAKQAQTEAIYNILQQMEIVCVCVCVCVCNRKKTWNLWCGNIRKGTSNNVCSQHVGAG